VLKLEVVGLLKNSMLQGDLLISEKAFLKHFPQTSGYRFFLVETEPTEVETALKVLEEGLGDYGFDAVRSEERLNELMAVQNTYLSTFQSLGGLGLLLGMFGLAVVQLRNVLERRGELALLRAAGFRRSLLARLVLLENWMLVAGGLGVGVVAALVAVLPHLFGGGAGVPWGWLALTLAVVLAGGMLAGLAAVRAAMAAAIVPALRGE
jgi:ABC-type antimicrobial peptide transport system permease subunit